MRLDERCWVFGAGLTPEWRWVGRKREEDALRRLKAAAAGLRKRGPAALNRPGAAAGMRYLLGRSGAARDRLLTHPCFDYWLFLWDKHFHLPTEEKDWRLQWGLLQGFAASLALARGERLTLEAQLDPSGRFFLHGTPLYFQAPPARAGAPLRLTLAGGKARAEGLSVRRLPEVVPGLCVDDMSWLTLHGVTMHGLARLDAPQRGRFVAVLRQALGDMLEREPGLHAELTSMVRSVVPLENSQTHGSVSSSYANLRGTIALSHSEDAILQAETLIHEFCHQKMNQLLVVDPALLPGQSGQVFYSPWRPDARRLRGLMLGAHAFLNVARYVATSLSRERFEDDRKIELMVNVALRLNQVESALRVLTGYGAFTEFGRRFVMGMWSELEVLRHAVLWFPPALRKEQAAAAAAHRKKHALGDTGFHKGVEHVDKVRRTAFLTPKEDEPREAA